MRVFGVERDLDFFCGLLRMACKLDAEYGQDASETAAPKFFTDQAG